MILKYRMKAEDIQEGMTLFDETGDHIFWLDKKFQVSNVLSRRPVVHLQQRTSEKWVDFVCPKTRLITIIRQG